MAPRGSTSAPTVQVSPTSSARSWRRKMTRADLRTADASVRGHGGDVVAAEAAPGGFSTTGRRHVLGGGREPEAGHVAVHGFVASRLDQVRLVEDADAAIARGGAVEADPRREVGVVRAAR